MFSLSLPFDLHRANCGAGMLARRPGSRATQARDAPAGPLRQRARPLVLAIASMTLTACALLVWQLNRPTPQEALFDAVDRGDAAAVARLLRSGAPADVVNETDCTPLLHAVLEGNADICDLLIRHGARPDSPQPYRPLPCATMAGNRRVVELLLRHGASKETVTEQGATLVMAAALFGHNDVIELVVEPDTINATDSAGDTALHMAAYGDWPQTAKLLLQYGADPRRRNLDGQTPAEAARVRGFLPLASLLDEAAASRPSKASTRPG